MKILLSAFAFAPNVGSEPGVGWRWAIELSRQHDVTVVTDTTRRALIEISGVQLPPTVRIFYFRPRWLSAVPLNSTTAQFLYTAWQFCILGFVRNIHRRESFDLAIHCTYSVFRHPSFLGYLGIPFIFGPVGGGEDAPFALKRSICGWEKYKEFLRVVANKIALVDPFLWLSYSRVTLILVSTDQTRHALPWGFRKRAVVYSNLGVDTLSDARPNCRIEGKPLQILFAGRLLGWKGVHLVIRAFAMARDRGVNIELTILGDGPYIGELRRVAASVRVEPEIRWLRHLPQPEVFMLYRSMHAFIFPSLHDSGGTVVLEAQSFGVPVICLDIGGPATLVTPDSAIIVSTHHRSEADVVHGLANAIQHLADDELSRFAMSVAAIKHAREDMSWERRVYGIFPLIDQAIRGG